MDSARDSELDEESGNVFESADELMELSSDTETLKYMGVNSDNDDDDDSARVDGEASSCETSTKTSVDAKQLISHDDGDYNDEDDDDAMASSRTRSTKTSVKGKQDSNEVVGDYWNPEEKALLLAFVKKFGMLNLNALAAVLKTKNVQQIKDFFTKVTRAVASDVGNRARKRAKTRMTRRLANKADGDKAGKKTVNAAKQKKQWRQMVAAESGEGPIDWWLTHMENILTKTSKQSEMSRKNARHPRTISDMIPRACLIISQYEDHPDPSLCSGVDYKEAYDYLYHVLSGVPPKSLSPPTAVFIQRSIERLRNSMLDGMYSPDFSKYFGAQVNHIKMAATAKRRYPAQTYGAPSNEPSVTMTEASGLPSPSPSMDSLMPTAGFNLMKVPESLTWRLGHKRTRNKSVPRRKHDLTRKDLPNGLFCETDIYAGPSKPST